MPGVVLGLGLLVALTVALDVTSGCVLAVALTVALDTTSGRAIAPVVTVALDVVSTPVPVDAATVAPEAVSVLEGVGLPLGKGSAAEILCLIFSAKPMIATAISIYPTNIITAVFVFMVSILSWSPPMIVCVHSRLPNSIISRQ